MAKAHIKRPDGTTILIEGSPQEVGELIRKIEGDKPTARKRHEPSRSHAKRPRASLSDLLISLVDGGYFKKPKDLAAVKTGLAELGQVYPVTTISPALFRVVQHRHLRRIKQDNRWLYTG